MNKKCFYKFLKACLCLSLADNFCCFLFLLIIRCYYYIIPYPILEFIQLMTIAYQSIDRRFSYPRHLCAHAALRDVIYLCAYRPPAAATHPAQPRDLSISLSTLRRRNVPLGILSISLPNINRFSQFFHCHTHWTICRKVICEYPTTP